MAPTRTYTTAKAEAGGEVEAAVALDRAADPGADVPLDDFSPIAKSNKYRGSTCGEAS